MISVTFQPVVRRAILDLIDDVGGELNDEMIALLLNELGHRVAREEVQAELRWLDAAGLIRVEMTKLFIEARSTSKGRDVARGVARVDGVSRHKTGE